MFGKSESDDKPGKAGEANQWRQWVMQPRAIARLQGNKDYLNEVDVSALRSWASKQTEWGLRVRLHTGMSSMPHVIEIFGPDLFEPHVILYRVGSDIQVDEAHGESRLCCGMNEALDFVIKHT